MEPIRSSPYSAYSYYSAATKQAELQAYLEHKQIQQELDQQELIKSDLQQQIDSRRRSSEINRDHPRATTVEVVVKQPPPAPAHPTTTRSPLAFGQSSTPFLAQQLSQASPLETGGHEIEPGSSSLYQQANTAYRETRNLTIDLLGFQGFRPKTV
ncbi:hypothetical protein [Sneathiella limimaris]|uniref:hypothetical protein n=1 Tax=Sneathiella limimaris TaxID=1964213 RepID=UPI00146C2428|nr:hypothetical protein [Sneathiella limimaris]